MRLLDTNVLSEIIRIAPDAGVVSELRKLRTSDIFASAVSRYELRYGASLRDNAASLWQKLERQVLPVAIWLPITQGIAERAGVIAAELRRKGRECGSLDPLLVATALEHDLIFVTRNTRHFEHVPGLAIENWFT